MSGHGHVTPNADGSKARCGGPAICSVCALELAGQRTAEPVIAPEPCKCIGLTDKALEAFNSRLGVDFQIDRKTGRVTSTVAIVTHVVEKKRGARPITMVATYCPFCGVRYQPEAS